MPRKRAPEHLLTQEQLRRRARNERYRSIKQSPPSFKKTSQTVQVSDASQSFETNLHLVEELEPLPSSLLPLCTGDDELMKSKPQVVEDAQSETSWVDVFRILIKPASMMLLIVIPVLTAYLVNQGGIFFAAIDPISARSNAVISELIPFLAAASFALTSKFSQKIIAASLLLVSIVGMGLFMHKSLADEITQGSGAYERLSKSREFQLASINSQTSTLLSLPESFFTKRQAIEDKIRHEREKLAEMDHQLNTLEAGAASSTSLSISYSVWLRVAAMILNAYLVHLFFSLFRHESRRRRVE